MKLLLIAMCVVGAAGLQRASESAQVRVLPALPPTRLQSWHVRLGSRALDHCHVRSPRSGCLVFSLARTLLHTCAQRASAFSIFFTDAPSLPFHGPRSPLYQLSQMDSLVGQLRAKLTRAEAAEAPAGRHASEVRFRCSR